MMKFHVIRPPSPHPAQSPIRLVEQASGREVGWVNRYLDREYLRRLADTSLRTFAYNLLHFVRWWESRHRTGDVREGDLTPSTLLEYVKFQSSQQPPPSGATINDRVAVADRALRNEFPDAPCQVARGFHQPFLQRRPLGLGRPRVAMSRLRVRVPQRQIVPLSVDEAARFWSSFRTARDLAIVGLMLLQGLRSAEVLGLNEDDLLLSEAQLRVRGKGNKLRFLPLAPETVQLLDHYRRLGAAPSRPHRALRLAQRTRTGNLHVSGRITFLVPLPSPAHRYPPRQPASLPPHLRLGHGTRRDQPARAHAVDGSRRHPDHPALCADHPPRRLPAVCARVAQHLRPVPKMPS